MKNSWKKKIYIASKLNTSLDDEGNLVNEYDKPIEYNMNVQPISGNSDIEIYGEKVMTMQKGVCDIKTYLNKFKPNDLAYLDGATPEGEKVNGSKANYRVDAVLNQNKIIAIYFERLPNR